MRLGNFDVMFNHDLENKVTSCDVYNVEEKRISERKPIFSGLSRCCNTDVFRKEIGRKISLTRAINTLPRPVRMSIWNDYKEMAKI